MLASSSGIVYAQHFCSGMEMISGITLGENPLSCGMETKADDCGNKKPVSEDHHCCKNQLTKVTTDDSFVKASFDLGLDKTFVAPFVSVFVLHEIEITSTEKIFFADYNPPPLEQDFTILYETFLI
jgi:hypothetical protein